MRNRQMIIIATLMLGGLLLIAAAVYILLVNPQSGDPATDIALNANEPASALRLTISESGLYELELDTLKEYFGNEVTLDEIALSFDGTPIPSVLSKDETSLYFYTEASQNVFDAPNVIWVEIGERTLMPQAADTNVAVGSGEPTTGRFRYSWEQNEIFVAFAETDDAWFGQRLFFPGELAEFALEINLTNPLPQPAQVTVQLWSNNAIRDINPDHHLIGSINGQAVLDSSWDGAQRQVISGTIPAGSLLDGLNNLQLKLPGDTGAPGEDMYLDHVHLDYDAALTFVDVPLDFETDDGRIQLNALPDDVVILNIDEPNAPIQITSENGTRSVAFDSIGNRYFVVNPADSQEAVISIVPAWEPLTAEQQGADFVAITANVADFTTNIAPLLAHREAQGLSAASINVRQIYDEFGYGRETPAAIRDFITYAVANWTPAPRFVLLVGDATYDVNNFVENSNRNLLPTFLLFTQHAGYVASDTWMAIPAGGDTPTPQVALGRLPVHSADDLTIMVDKIISYESQSDASWNQRALLVADDEAGFDTVTEALTEQFDSFGYETEALHMSENEDIHASIMNAFNQGVGIVNYVGHGSVGVWGDEQVLKTENASEMSNEGQYPIFITFTCLNGYFNHPEVDALAEALLRVESGGIVAAIAPSGRSLTSQQEKIADVFYELMLTTEAETLGEALQIAKQEGAGDVSLNDVIHTFNLLGDPALRFNLPPASGE